MVQNSSDVNIQWMNNSMGKDALKDWPIRKKNIKNKYYSELMIW